MDDNQVIREIMERALPLHGLSVWLASNGWEAVEIYFNHRSQIDLVLLDVCMPGRDGPETLKVLRGLDPTVRYVLSASSKKRFPH